jgi:tetratricopeptide (TPR) repeat protein
MKRPQRYLFIIMTVMVAGYLLLTRLPGEASLSLLGILIIFFIVVAILARDWFIARRHAKRNQWAQAITHYQRLEKKLLTARWHRLTVALFPSIYSLDSVAIVRNTIAQCFLQAEDLEQAVSWLRSALQRDPLYAVPYVNLALIAAIRKDETNARREMTRAVQLGFNPLTAQRILHRALTRAMSDDDGRV